MKTFCYADVCTIYLEGFGALSARRVLWNLPRAISLGSVSAVDCLGQVLQRDYKNTIMTSFYNFGIRNFHIL